MNFGGLPYVSIQIRPSNHLQVLVFSNGLFQVQVLLQGVHLLQEPQRLAMEAGDRFQDESPTANHTYTYTCM